MSELNLGNQIAKYYKSFSGTDTLAFIMMPGCSPVIIGSLTTISYSMYRNKKPVINIGRTNINGVTRGSRIFAGTMIFTLINQHWLKELQEQIDYIKNFPELKVDELPLFDVMIISANEYGNAVSMYIYGIDFTDEAQVISVEDLFTENTFSFVARDVSNFHQLTYQKTSHGKSAVSNPLNAYTQKSYVLGSSTISFDDVARLEQELTHAQLITNHLEKKYNLLRDLYLSTANIMIGNDVAEIQELLNKLQIVTPINGIFDETMDAAVKKYQSMVHDTIDGIVDNKLYNLLMNTVSDYGTRLGVVVNKYGAFVYRNMSLLSDIVDTKSYRTQIEIFNVDSSEENGKFQRWYQIGTGYVLEEDIYSSYYTGGIIEFPIIEYNDNNAYVTLVQSALDNIFPAFNNISKIYDTITLNQIKILQEMYGLTASGIVDNDTWLLLQSLSGEIFNKVYDDNFTISHNIAPGIYTVSDRNIIEQLSSYNSIISCDNLINVKASTISIFKDKLSETITKTIQIKDFTTVALSEFRNAFVYNPKHGSAPIQVDFVIYPYNKKPYKWSIKYE